MCLVWRGHPNTQIYVGTVEQKATYSMSEIHNWHRTPPPKKKTGGKNPLFFLKHR